MAYYEASDQGAKSVFIVWFPWSLAGILFSITLTRMTRKIEEMEQMVPTTIRLFYTSHCGVCWALSSSSLYGTENRFCVKKKSL
ncbi:hypothetical protein FE411_09215 [Leuconostoc mesenteroides]|nr:hypothetical protein FE411_09215 [Leuconostoc mesenteroides]MCT8385851.1 hypothetical protein [Leuconostoc mesenteroides]